MPKSPPIRASTQEALPIEEIRDDLVVLKDGSAALILQVGAINFDLLSEKEQTAIIFAYGSLLNSLSFPVQIFIRSQKKDITAYTKLLENTKAGQKNPLLKKMITSYQKFIKETVTRTEILDKKFYLIIPFSFLELGAIRAMGNILSKNKKNPLPADIETIIQKAKTSLIPKRDHLIRIFSRVGLKAHQLTTNELIRLFFRIYNPGAKGAETTLSEDYTVPIVETVKNLKSQNAKLKSTTQKTKNSNISSIPNVKHLKN